MTAPRDRKTQKKNAPTLRGAMKKHLRAAYQEAILQAAADLFGKVGFIDARMADIAEAAGVSVGTLYNYFGSKDAVVQALHDHEMDELGAALARVADTPDPCERLRLVIEATFGFVQERGALMAMAVQSGLLDKEVAAKHGRGEHDEVQRALFELYQGALSEAVRTGKVRRDLDPVRMSVALDGMVSALIFDWIRSRRKKPLTDQTDFVFNLFMKGAGAR